MLVAAEASESPASKPGEREGLVDAKQDAASNGASGVDISSVITQINTPSHGPVAHKSAFETAASHQGASKPGWPTRLRGLLCCLSPAAKQGYDHPPAAAEPEEPASYDAPLIPTPPASSRSP